MCFLEREGGVAVVGSIVVVGVEEGLLGASEGAAEGPPVIVARSLLGAVVEGNVGLAGLEGPVAGDLLVVLDP